MYKRRTLLLLTLLLTCNIGLSHAKQLGFSRKYREDKIIMTYTWQDRYREKQSLQFKLPISAAAKGNNEFQKFDNNAANTAAFNAIKKYSTKYPGVDVRRTFSGFEMAYKGRNAVTNQATHSQNIKVLQEQAYEKDIKRQYHVKLDDAIMPDHRAVITRYTPALRPLAHAIKQATLGEDTRTVINFALNFFQSIPYDKLLNRATTNGAGFQTPYGLLINNRGDCDTKTVALAALIKNLYPQSSMAMVYIPNHAFLAISGLPNAGDTSVRLGPNRTPYVLLDPTGPALALLGEIPPSSLQAIERGQHSYLAIPR